MTNAEKINQFLDDAKVFYLLTTDGNSQREDLLGFILCIMGRFSLVVQQ